MFETRCPTPSDP